MKCSVKCKSIKRISTNPWNIQLNLITELRLRQKYHVNNSASCATVPGGLPLSAPPYSQLCHWVEISVAILRWSWCSQSNSNFIVLARKHEAASLPWLGLGCCFSKTAIILGNLMRKKKILGNIPGKSTTISLIHPRISCMVTNIMVKVGPSLQTAWVQILALYS